MEKFTLQHDDDDEAGAKHATFPIAYTDIQRVISWLEVNRAGEMESDKGGVESWSGNPRP